MVPWRSIFFAINFSAAVLFVMACVAAVGQSWYGESPYAFLGGACFVWPAGAFGVGEWFLYVRRARSLEVPLGVACGFVGVGAIFAFASNAVEARAGGAPASPRFWLCLGAGCLGVAAYALWCSWLRVRGRTCPEPRGFPVDPQPQRGQRDYSGPTKT